MCSTLRGGIAWIAVLAAAWLVPAAAGAVATTLEVTTAEGPIANQTIIIVDETGTEVDRGETDRHGVVVFDLGTGGSYTAMTPDGTVVSAPFPAGGRVPVSVPSPGTTGRTGGPGGGLPPDWWISVQGGPGYTGQQTDTSTMGGFDLLEEREVCLTDFPDDCFLETFRGSTFYNSSSGATIDSAAFGGDVRIGGPPIGPVRPIFVGGAPNLGATSQTVASADGQGDDLLNVRGRDPSLQGFFEQNPQFRTQPRPPSQAELRARMTSWYIAALAGLPIGGPDSPWLATFGLAYGQNIFQLRGRVDGASAGETLRTHLLGPAGGIQRTIYSFADGHVQLFVYAHGQVLFPIANDSQDVVVDGVVMRFEAETAIQGNAGLGLLFGGP